ncbi:MAG: NAD(P)-dependent glycerol-3-phosphate dehydrogenase [Candidatus Aminicenantes bacterium]|nr:NAD(P)-dependent glycerol-3-phosphate dehydrogenase [Candidatus Aminicenantes bacterium]
MKAAVIGGGSWGTAFAVYLGRIGIPTRLWIREPDVFEAARRDRENPVFLPGHRFPEAVSVHQEIGQAMDGAEAVFVAVPSQHCRQIYSRMSPYCEEGQAVISLTKGIEKRTLLRMSEVMGEVFDSETRPSVGVLSGPSFAREVAEGHPTALILASRDSGSAGRLQHRLSSPSLRVYTTRDVAGVEVAGALKNIIAIAAGILDAMAFGHNALASLITRGLAEIARLGIKLGARRDTFAGLAGLGDLVLTCTGPLSRNRRVGRELGAGRRLSEVLAGARMVAEGIPTTVSARELAKKKGVEMPITEQVYQVLCRKKPPRRALADLMARELRSETDGFEYKFQHFMNRFRGGQRPSEGASSKIRGRP